MDRWFWLNKALENLEALRGQSPNEKETQRLIVEPLLVWIGYPIWEPGVITEDIEVQGFAESYKPDYALMNDKGKIYILVEAKRLGEYKDDYLDKLGTACDKKGVRFGILTDGRTWALYDCKMKGEAFKRVVFRKNLDDEGVPHLLLILHTANLGHLKNLISEIKKVRGRPHLENAALEEAIKKLPVPEKIETAIKEMELREIPKKKEGTGKKPELTPSAQYWLITVANTEEESAVDCITKLLRRGIFAIPPKRYLKPGDWVVFYAGGIGCVAKARIKKLLQELPDGTGLSHEYKTIFKLQDVEIFTDNPVFPDEKLRRNLEAFKGKSSQAFKHWYWFVQGTQRITRGDFELLTSWKP